jgi:hypothetical protein
MIALAPPGVHPPNCQGRARTEFLCVLSDGVVNVQISVKNGPILKKKKTLGGAWSSTRTASSTQRKVQPDDILASRHVGQIQTAYRYDSRYHNALLLCNGVVYVLFLV